MLLLLLPSKTLPAIPKMYPDFQRSLNGDVVMMGIWMRSSFPTGYEMSVYSWGQGLCIPFIWNKISNAYSVTHVH